MSPRLLSRNGFFAQCRRAKSIKRSDALAERSARTVIEPLEARIALSVTIVGTLQDSYTDADGDGKAEVGDTIHYTETIQNTGDTDATLVQVQHALDAATTLVPGSVKISPLAIKHSYLAAGNTALDVDAAGGLKLGAMDLDGVTSFANLEVVTGTFTTSAGGKVTVRADGSFTYVPETGDKNVSDTFTYSITDSDGLVGTGTVTIGVGDAVWYVDSNYAGANGASDGSSLKPYSSLSQISGSAGLDQAGDTIYIKERAGDYDGNLTLLNGQKLYGSGANLTVNGIAINTAGAHTTFVATAANASAITLGSNNEVYGISVGNTTDSDISGTSVGALKLGNVILSGTGRALNLANGTITAAIGSLTVTSSSSEGIRLSNIGGSLTVSAGSISGAALDDIYIDKNSGTVDLAVNITNTANNSVEITGMTAGSITLSGNISDTGAGISIHDNTSGTITFSGTSKTLNTGANAAISLNTNAAAVDTKFINGGLVISTTSGIGLFGNSGGKLTVSGAGNTVNSTNQTAISLTGTTISSDGLTFQSVSSANAAKGIVLNNTGTGPFTITGSGTTDGSGGTIQNISARGIELINASNVTLKNLTLTNANTTDAFVDDTNTASANAAISLSSVANLVLDNVDINGAAQIGINGNNVSGFILRNSTITKTGNATHEDAIKMRNLTGTAQILNSDLSFAGANIFQILNTGGTLNLLVKDSTFRDTQTVSGGGPSSTGEGGLEVRAFGGSNVTVDVDNSNFRRLRTQGIQVITEDTSTASVDITRTTIDREAGIGTGIDLNANDNSTLQFNVVSNPLINSRGGAAVNITAFGNGTVEGRVTDNTSIQAGGVGTSGSGVRVGAEDNGRITVDISRNTIGGIGFDDGIEVFARNTVVGTTGTARINATIANNNITVSSGALYDIELRSGSSTAGATENTVISADLSNNTVSAAGSTGFGFRVRTGSTASRIYLEGFNINSGTTWVNRGNTPGVVTTVSQSTIGGGTAPSAPPDNGGLTPMPSNGSLSIASAVPLLFTPNEPAPADADEPGSTSGDPTSAGNTGTAGDVGNGNGSTPSSNPSGTNILDQAELDALVSAAIQRWEATGLTPAQIALLQSVSFTVRDLPGWYLGEADGTQITLDLDGAGNGWFVDTTPLDDSEFSGTGTRLGATADGGAAGRVDALTTVMHELGHVLGLDDTYSGAERDNLMYGWIGWGERRVAAAHQAEGTTSHTHEGSAFALSPLAIGTLSAGSSVQVVFDAKVNNPFTNTLPTVSAQGTISGSNFADVLTNDPDTVAAADATVTQIDLPDVTLAVSSSSVPEDGATNLVYTFKRTGDLSGALTVKFNVGGAATFGTDYSQSGAASFAAGNGTVTFAVGSDTATVTITPTADTTVEPDEAVSLTLTSGTGYDVSSPGTVTGTITNDDTDVKVELLSGTSVTEDGASNLVYTFTRTGVTTDAKMVNFSVTGSPTLTSSDYAILAAAGVTFDPSTGTGTVTFNPGELTKTITLDPTVDSTLEADENAVVTVTSGPGYNVVGSPATGTILNDDANVTVSISPASVAEDGAGVLVYTFVREGFTASALRVDFNVGGTANRSNDYVVSSASSGYGLDPVTGAGFVTFAPGATSVTYTISPTDDTTAEPDETVSLTLNSGSGYTAATSTPVVGTILNDDTIVTLTIGSQSSITENVSDTILYTFTRTGDINDPATTVNFTLGGTGTHGADYTLSGATITGNIGTVVIPTGSTSVTVAVSALNDTFVEGDETVQLNLISGAGYGVGTPGAVVGTITDNDFATVSLVSGTSTVSEGTATHNVGVQLLITADNVAGTGTLERPVSLNLSDLLSGTATGAGSDYTLSAPTVTFASGEAGSTKNVAITIVNDARVEGDETIKLALNTLLDGTGTQVSLGNLTAHTVTITDNDTATVSLVSGTSTVGEGTATHNVGVQLVITADGSGTPTLDRDVKVNLSDLLSGTAAAGGIDYTLTSPQTLTFLSGAGNSTQNVSIALVNDARVEGDETIKLGLGTLVDGTGTQVSLGNTTAHTVTITDNDTATVSLVSGTSSVGEGTATHNVGVQLVITANGSGTPTLERDVKVNLADLLSGTATGAGSDYSFTSPQTLTFLSGSGNSTQNVSIALVNDAKVEGDETIKLGLGTLVDGTGTQVSLGNTTAHTVTITDNDTATVSLVSGTSSVGEGTATHNVGVQLVITANGSGTPTLDRDVKVNLADLLSGTAAAGGIDYTLTSPQTLTFLSGAGNSTQNVSIALVNDAKVEGDETIKLGLGTLVDGTGTQVSLGNTTAHTVTITDNDTATVSLVSGTSSVGEGTATHNVGVQLVITANGSGTPTLERDVKVNLSDLLSGTATGAGSDYTLTSPQTLTFLSGAGNSTQNVAITLVNDAKVEGDETIKLGLGTLVDGTGTQVSLGNTTAHTVTITDNDTATVSLVSGTSTVGEGTATHNVGVQLVITANGSGTPTLERDVKVNLSDLLSGTAAAGGIDYTLTSPQTLTFLSGAGNSTQNVSIALVNDAKVEGDETIKLGLGTLVDGTGTQVSLGNTTAHTVTITDNDTATVSLVSGTSSVGEGTATHNVGVQLVITANGSGTPTLERDVKVNLSDLLSGTATGAGSDYTLTSPQTLTFLSGAGNSTQNVSIALVNDAKVEGDETIKLGLGTLVDGTGTQVSLGNTTAHTVTITDNDTATVSLVSGTSSVGEGTATHNVGVQLVITANGSGTPTLERDVKVNLSDLLSGTAAAGGVDYTLTSPQTLTFLSGAGNSTQNVSIALVNDARVEGDETIKLGLGTLVDGTGTQVSLGNTTAHTVTITDNDTATVSLVSGTSSVGEGTATHNVGVQLVITANGSGTPTLERDVKVNLSDLLSGTATGAGSDYSFDSPQTLTFLSGAGNSTQNVAITLINDAKVEGDETIKLGLGTLVDGSGTQVTLGAVTNQTITIQDNDTATVSLVSSTSSVGEGTESHNVGVQLVITANGSGTPTLDRDVKVNLADLLSGTATGAGSDYSFTSPQTLTFLSGAGNSTQNATITLVNDARVEGDETIKFGLGALVDGTGTQVSLGTAAHTVTITDNDTATVSLVSGTSSVSEGAGAHNVGVQLVITADGSGTPTLERDVKVNLSDLLSGTATAGGSDYTLTSPQTVTFASGTGNSTQNVSIALVNDARVEGDETIQLGLGALNDGTGTQVALGNTTTHTVTITDNDTATVSLVSGTSSANEGTATHNVGVQLVITADGSGTPTLERAISVNLEDLLSGTATVASDYSLVSPQTVTFNSGEAGSTKSVSITVSDDTRVEGQETINVQLNSLSDGTKGQVSIGAVSEQTITIVDNDTASISFVSAGSTVGEGTATHNVGVQLVITANGVVGNGTLERDVVVNVQDLLTGTASVADYTFSNPQTVTFAAGEAGSTKNVSLAIVNDLLSEGDETINLQLKSLVDGTGTQVSLAAPTDHVVTIADNDIDVHVTTTESIGTVIAGSGAGNLIYVVTVANTGLTNATGIVLSESLKLPAGVTVQSVTPSTGAFEVTALPDGNWQLGNLAAGAQATLTVVLTVDASAAEGIDVIGSKTSLTSANQTIVNSTDDSATESTSIDRQVDLQITADDGVTTAVPGGTHSYVLNVKNVGPSNATGVVITETLPSGTTFNAAASTAGWTETAPGSGIYTLALGTVAGSGSATPVTFAVTVANPAAAGLDELVNAASVADDGTAGADLVVSSNRAEDVDVLNAAPELSLVVTDNIATMVAHGGLVYYTLTYSNVGNQDATGVFLHENVPAHSTFVASESDPNWVLQEDGSYHLAIGNLAAGTAAQSVVFAVRVDGDLPGVRWLANTGSIDDDGTNSGLDLKVSDVKQTLIYQGIYVISPGITLPKQGPPAAVRVIDIASGQQTLSILAYGETYRDSLRVAVGDLNGDGFDDIITATRTSTGKVRVFDGVTGEQFGGAFAEINPFNGRSQKGAFVAAGDVTGDGHDDIVVGSALGGGKVQIYDGLTGSLVTSYDAFGKTYKGGVRLTLADVNGDGVDDVVASQGNFGNAVKVFSGTSSEVIQKIQVGGKNYKGGISVAAADIDSDGKADIITGRNMKSPPWVEVFRGGDSAPLGKFLAFEAGFRNGIRVAAADLNVDGIVDIIVGAGFKGDSQVKTFSGNSQTQFQFNEFGSLTAFPDYPDVSMFVAASIPVPVVAAPRVQPV